MADQWTMVFVRGILLFSTLSFGWFVARWMGDRAPFLAGGAGIAVACASTLGNISYIGAVVHAPAANVVFLIALTPVIAASLSHLVLGEKVHGYTWTATILALCGAALIASQGIDSGHWVGDGLAMVSAFCSATILTIIRATGRKVATSLALGSLASSLIALMSFNIVPSTLFGTGAFGVPSLVWLGLNGLIVMPLATVLLARGPRLLPSADVSMFFMLETILTPIWTWMLFAEAPSPRVLAGGLLLILTLLAHSWWRLAVSMRTAQAISSDRP
ncbi:DMT family transporter [Aestuariivirga litoralis]|nr:DMT family transporter [Aestuariivirga litoralis]